MSKNDERDAPSQWTSLPIGELLARLDDGRTMHQGWSPRCEIVPSESESEWGVLKTTAVQAGSFLPEHNKRLPSHLDPRPHLEVKPGDILVTCAGPRSRCGVACLVRATRARLMLSGKMYRFRPDTTRVDPRYLEAYLQSADAQAAIDEMKTGGNESGLNLTHDRFRRLSVPLASLADQRRIVAELERQFSCLDEAVTSLKRVRANLKRYKAAVLSAAVEGRLVRTDVELARHDGQILETGEQLLRRLLEKRKSLWKGKGKYAEPCPPDTAELPPLPDGWTYATAEQLTDPNRTISYGVIKLGPPVDGGVPVLRSSDVRNLRIDLQGIKTIAPSIAAEYRRTFLEGGEVIITVRGTLGGIAVAPITCKGFNVSREIAMLAMVEPELAYAVAQFIAAPPIQRWLMTRTKGIAYTGINIETLRALPLPVPPLHEQRRICAETERLLSLGAALDLEIESNIRRAQRFREVSLEHAFLGSL